MLNLGFLGARAVDPAYRFLFEPAPPGEAVAIDCETTGLDRRKDDIVSIAAIRLRDDRILTSQRFVATIQPDAQMKPAAIKVHRLREADVKGGRAMADVLPQLLRFIGSRPLVGYYLEFDVAMLNKHVRALLGIKLPNRRIETSELYCERKYGNAPPGTQIDLTFAAMMRDLKVPLMAQHDAYSDALMTAIAFIMLRDLKARGARIPRQR
ncbi:MAG: 3'-5' exonuclease [Hyphomicrobiales bacterium]